MEKKPMHLAISIKWDTDGEDVDLPQIVFLPPDTEEDQIADWLSDQTGWCVESYDDVTVSSIEELLHSMPRKPEDAECGYWSDGEEIVCKTESLANIMADSMEELYPGISAATAYYDPVEDENDDCVDEYTGWWTVTLI